MGGSAARAKDFRQNKSRQSCLIADHAVWFICRHKCSERAGLPQQVEGRVERWQRLKFSKPRDAVALRDDSSLTWFTRSATTTGG